MVQKKSVKKEAPNIVAPVGKFAGKHLTTIKGLSFLICGLILIGLTSPVIIKLLVLIAGGFLVYAGLQTLRYNGITRFIDDVLKKIGKQGK